MAGCNYPLSAWKPPTGRVQFGPPNLADRRPLEYVKVPCGKCLGCQEANAKSWAFRCRLEWVEHRESCWATLTYSDKYLPPTLSRQHLAAYLKRLRARKSDRVIRFFGCGEYGDKTHRPHYHVILFGMSLHEPEITQAWGMGRVQVDPLTPAAINYVAGYTAKKIGYDTNVMLDRVDPETGEAYRYQKPFLQMSRRPGIAAGSKQFVASWRDYAVNDGNKQAVPRYLHEAYLATLTPEEVTTHKEEKRKKAVQLQADGPARERELENKLKMKREKRKL